MAKSIGKNAVVEEQVIEWKDESFISLDAILIENISGLKTMGGDFYFSKNSNKTIVKATLKYSMTNVFFGMMNAMMGRKKFTKTWKSIMAGYKLHTETGVIVTEKTVLPVEEVKLLEVKKHLNK